MTCAIRTLLITAITETTITTAIATTLTLVTAMKTIIAIINKTLSTAIIIIIPVKSMEIIAILNNATKMEQPITQVWKMLDRQLKVR